MPFEIGAEALGPPEGGGRLGEARAEVVAAERRLAEARAALNALAGAEGSSIASDQRREIDRRVARDEDVAVTGAHRQVIISGDAMGIERERGVFQSEIVDIGPSACGREEIIEPLLAPR